MSRLLSWFTSKSGRTFSKCCVVSAAAVAFGNHVAINGPCIDNFQQIVQAYRQGQPRPLSSKVNQLLEEVLQECILKEEEKKKLKFFYVIGHDLFHAGGTNSPWGAIVGIPFSFENIEDINFGELKIAGKESVDWIIDGQDLIKALTISDSAKKFALMREVYSCNFSLILQNATINSVFILMMARFIQVMNVRMKAFERFSLKKRSTYYILFYCVGYLMYRCMKDPLKHLSDKEADRLAAEIGPDYLNGGIEYYKKTLLKHKALRDLSDSQFKNAFDEQGNENYFIFAPKLPISKRLDNLREMRKNIIAKA